MAGGPHCGLVDRPIARASGRAEGAARRLAAGALLSGFRFEALHTYTNREANPLYWRIRAKHPVTGKKWIRPMKLTGTGYELREPMKPVNGKPLYRLHELVSRPDNVVIVTEGEYKADRLAALGLGLGVDFCPNIM